MTKVLDGKYSVRYVIGGADHNLDVEALSAATTGDTDGRNNSHATTRSGTTATGSSIAASPPRTKNTRKLSTPSPTQKQPSKLLRNPDDTFSSKRNNTTRDANRVSCADPWHSHGGSRPTCATNNAAIYCADHAAFRRHHGQESETFTQPDSLGVVRWRVPGAVR